MQTALADFRLWGERVYRYLHADDVAPLRLVISESAGFGYYRNGSVYVPPSGRSEMLETWIHELTHHVTGHDSSFFFKEGIASHTLEALFASQGRIPQGWPQYGVHNDDWVQLFRARGELTPLAEALSGPRRRVSSSESDFRSWQRYLIGASFVGWYLERYGIVAFRQAFSARKPEQPLVELERLWLAYLDAREPVAFDPAQQLPSRERYRYFVRRLAG